MGLRAIGVVIQRGKINTATAQALEYFCAHTLFPLRFLTDAGIGTLAFEKTNKQTPALKSTEKHHVRKK